MEETPVLLTEVYLYDYDQDVYKRQEITGSRAIRVADPMTAETTEETIATTGITETETTAEEMKDLPFLHRLYRNRSRVVTRQRIKKKITRNRNVWMMIL